MRDKKGKLTVNLMMLSIAPLLVFGLVVTMITSVVIYSSLRREVEYSLNVLGPSSYQIFEFMYPGDYELEDGILKKGGHSLEDQNVLVDDLKQRTGVDATLFYGDERYLTTIMTDSGVRAVGTKAEKLVSDTVLGKEESYFSDNVSVNGTPYFGYYIPVYNSDGSAVGMMFVGRSRSDVMREINKNIILVFLSAVLIMTIAAAVSLHFSKKVLYSLDKTEEFLGEIAKGDLTAEIDPYLLERNDEIGEMGRFAVLLRNSIGAMAGRDVLTGLHNRRSCDMVLNSLVSKGKQEGFCFAAAMGDIDYFKKINDTYGHQAGDEILKMVSHIISRHMEPYGFAFRWGGEEFLLIYEEMDREAASEKLEQFRTQLLTSGIMWEGQQVHVQMTFGVADNREESEIEKLIQTADFRLYQGKKKGRDQVVFE